MKPLDPLTARYSDRLTYVEFLLASQDEAALESNLMKDDGTEGACVRAALRKIDQWQRDGVYESEQAKLLELHARDMMEIKRGYEKLAGRPWPSAQGFTDSHALQGWERFRAGLRSPDEAQRARFSALFETIKDKGPADPGMIEMMEVLEPVRGAPGRKRGRAHDDSALLIEMKKMVFEGMSKRAAASKLASRIAGGKNLQHESKISRLEKGYRAKMALRKQGNK